MTKYERVQQILGDAAGGALPGHDGQGRFWEQPLNQFEALTIYGVQLIAPPGPNRGRDSGLIKALKGESPFDGSTFARMPLGRPPVSATDIQFIEDWIDDGLPNDEIDDPGTIEPPGEEEAPDPDPDADEYGTPACQTGYLTYNGNPIRGSVDTVKIRKNILALSDTELTNFRAAIQALKDLPGTDERSYASQAAIHGTACRHNSELFLTWHRAYLYRFELVLQEFFPGVTLPYWDFLNTREIPGPYADPAPNPLFNSTRTPGGDFNLPSQQEIDDLMALNDFDTFGGAPVTASSPGDLELNAHNGVHNFVGGDLSSVPTAANDPLFWALHSNVDRLWAEWQRTHTDGPVDLAAILEPFNMSVSQTLSVTDLGYDYAGTDSVIVVDNTQGCAHYRSDKIEIPRYLLECGYKRAKVTLHKVRYPRDSYLVRVYLNNPDADPRTGADPDQGYAGCFRTFGHGQCIGGPGHCDPDKPRSKYDRRPPHHYDHYAVNVDVTNCLHRITSDYDCKGNPEVQISFVAIDGSGKSVPNSALRCDHISFSVHE